MGCVSKQFRSEGGARKARATLLQKQCANSMALLHQKHATCLNRRTRSHSVDVHAAREVFAAERYRVGAYWNGIVNKRSHFLPMMSNTSSWTWPVEATSKPI